MTATVTFASPEMATEVCGSGHHRCGHFRFHKPPAGGADSFVIRGGKIVAQTIHYTVEITHGDD